jgi:ADP-heptose:LPS heptosyltransferase
MLGLVLTHKYTTLSLENINHILFIRIDRIGDLVLSTAALRTIKQFLPSSTLTVLASPSNAPLLINNPYVDQILVYDGSATYLESFRIIQLLKKCDFDLTIDPYPDYELRTAFLSFLSGAKYRAGYSSFGREIFFNIKAHPFANNKHFIDSTLQILREIGIPTSEKSPEIFLRDEEKIWADHWIKERKISGINIIGIHPGGHYESQRWLSEYVTKLINDLDRNNIGCVILFGGPTDQDVIQQILKYSNNDIITFVQNDLRKYAALLSHCRLLVCNNSGPLHIAVAMKVPTLSFMGPTIKDQWMPIGQIHTVLRVDNLSCIGCNLGYCKINTHDCMRLITPDMVIESITEILKIQS